MYLNQMLIIRVLAGEYKFIHTGFRVTVNEGTNHPITYKHPHPKEIKTKTNGMVGNGGKE